MEDFILQSYEELQRQADRERWTVATAEFSPAQLQAISKRLRYAAIRVQVAARKLGKTMPYRIEVAHASNLGPASREVGSL